MVDIGLYSANIRDWIDNLLWKFSNSGFSTQSFWFQNMNMWLFKLNSSHYWWRKKMNKVLYIIFISLFSFTIFSCSSSDDSKTTTSSVSFVAVGNSGTLLTSSDGITWTSRTSGTTKSLNGITYANNSFMTVGESGTILTSSDGTTWTSRTSGTTNNVWGVTYK